MAFVSSKISTCSFQHWIFKIVENNNNRLFRKNINFGEMANEFTEYRSQWKVLLFAALLLTAISINAQTAPKFYSKDFNEDGISDDFIVNYFLGMLDYAMYTDGLTKTQYKFIFQRQETKHGIVKITPIPYYFKTEKGEKALPKIDSLLFNIPLTKNIDPSLVWLLDNYVTKTKSTSKYFSNISSFEPSWISKSPELPNNYRLAISDTTLLYKMYESQHLKDTSSNAYVTYLGKFQSRAISMTKSDINIIYPILLDSTSTFKIYQTGHGVYIKKDSSYCWVFTSDGGLYNNIQKLEWESIQQIETYKDFILVLNQPYPAIQNSLFIVDWKRGRTFELNHDFLLAHAPDYYFIDNIQIMENELFLFVKTRPSADLLKQIRIDLSPIIEEMGKTK